MRTRPAVIALIALCAVGCGAAPAPLPSALDAPDYVDHREAALEAFRDGRLEQGLAEAEAALHVSPGASQPWSLLSEAYARSRGHAEAVETFARLGERYPRSAQAPFQLGWHLIRLERPQEARDAFRRALELDASLVNAHAALARLLLDDARYDEAIEHLRRASELAPTARSTGDLVTGLREAGRPEEALALAVEAAETYDAAAEFPFAAGVLRVELGNDAEAEAAFREALRRDPEHDRAQYELGLLLLRSDRVDEGGTRVALAQRLRDYNAVYGALTARAAARTDEPSVALKLAELDMTLARPDAALRWISVAERRGAAPAVVAAERAWVYYSRRRIREGDEALSVVGRAAFPRALLARAAGAAAAGEDDRAAELLERAIADAPEEKSFLRRAADLAATLDLEERAMRLHERAAAAAEP